MKKFDADFKKNAVKLVIEEKLPIKQGSQDLGVGHSTLNSGSLITEKEGFLRMRKS